jgi:hypothetical protein
MENAYKPARPENDRIPPPKFIGISKLLILLAQAMKSAISKFIEKWSIP